jgi:hypothetical protein
LITRRGKILWKIKLRSVVSLFRFYTHTRCLVYNFCIIFLFILEYFLLQVSFCVSNCRPNP